MHRLPEQLAGSVPAREVESGAREMTEPVDVRKPPERHETAPERLGFEHRRAAHERCQLRHDGAYGLDRRSRRRSTRLAPSNHTVLRSETDDDVRESEPPAFRRLLRLAKRDRDREDVDGLDPARGAHGSEGDGRRHRRRAVRSEDASTPIEHSHSIASLYEACPRTYGKSLPRSTRSGPSVSQA
jgi:hypothetical protein